MPMFGIGFYRILVPLIKMVVQMSLVIVYFDLWHLLIDIAICWTDIRRTKAFDSSP